MPENIRKSSTESVYKEKVKNFLASKSGLKKSLLIHDYFLGLTRSVQKQIFNAPILFIFDKK